MAQSIGQPGRRRTKRGSLATGDTQAATAQSATFSLSPGYVIGGKYRIEGLLGQGGMGAVYQSTHLVSDKKVAVKWMLPAASATEELAERFVREARATARIDHPNVVDIYDVGTQDGSVYLVMELLHGESLAKRLDRGPMDATEAASVLMHALRAVAAAHGQGVIHRDLKPDNIFLCQGPDGEPREPKVVDFGISKIADMRDMSLTQSGMVMGTPYYMSPEQVRGLRDVDERGDVYAFGVILYEMLTGECPFDAETYNQLILKIVTEEPTPLTSLRPDVDPQLGAVIARAMARSRDDRYPTVAALAVDLEPFAGGVTFRRSSSLPGAQTPGGSQPALRPSHARTPLTAERSARPAARRRMQLALMALVLLAAIGAGAWWRAASRGAVQASTPAPTNDFMARPATPVITPQPAVAGTVPATTAVVRGVAAEAAEPPAAPEANSPPSQAATHPTSHTPRRRAAATATLPATVPDRRGLPADWDEHLPTAPARTGAAPRASSAGKLGRDDL